MSFLDTSWPRWIHELPLVAGAALVGLLVHAALFALLPRIARRSSWQLGDALLRRLRGPSRLLLPVLAAMAVMPEVRRRLAGEPEPLGHALGLLLIGGAAWVAVAITQAIEARLLASWRMDEADNLEARRVHTRTRILKRTLISLVVVVALGAALMTFPRVRQLGASLLASAGIVGLALGIAARPMLENLIAGIQLALTQPVRLDDVVVVEGEWGRVEEITGTYVVVRIWDERRLVVPFSRFISEPFQNWTRTTADLLGSVVLRADYSVPVQAVREELERLVEQDEDWDGRVCNLQVTEAGERTLELRALVSAGGSGRAWNLRCRVREGLVSFLQREHPGALPRARVEARVDAEAPLPHPDAGLDPGQRGEPRAERGGR